MCADCAAAQARTHGGRRGARDVRSRTSGDKAASRLSRRRGTYGHFGDGEECGVRERSRGRDALPVFPEWACPATAGQAAQPSAALSEFVEGLRRQKAQRGRRSPLGLEDWPTLPIYQTTGASTRGGLGPGSDEGRPGAESRRGSALDASAGLPRSTSLKCISSQSVGAPARPRKLKTASAPRSPTPSGPSSQRTPSSRRLRAGTRLLSPTLRPRALSGVLGG